MDPLSVAASIAGLLQATQSISSIIAKIISCKKTANAEIQEVKFAVDTIRSVLAQLQQLLLRRATINTEHASLIMVDQIVITLSACVTTFSDLDKFVRSVDSDSKLGLLDSLRWGLKAPEIKEHMHKLENHKSSLTLMMTILTCDSTYTARDSASELVVLLKQVLSSHETLAARLSATDPSVSISVRTTAHTTPRSIFSSEPLSVHVGTGSTFQSSQTNAQACVEAESDSSAIQEVTSTHPDPEASSIVTRESIRSNSDSDSNVVPGEVVQYTPVVFTFEEELNKSWVYQRAIVRGPGTFSISIAISSEKTISWSMLSGISLSNMSNIAVQALPIYAEDLFNSELYQFGEVHKIPGTVVPIFGMPLNRIPATALMGLRMGSSHIYQLPLVIVECVEFIGRSWATQGCQLNTLFISKGSVSVANDLRRAFDLELEGTVDQVTEDHFECGDMVRNVPEDVQGNSILPSRDAHDVATCLHKYLCMLPEPIIPFKSYTHFVSIKATRKDDRLRKLSTHVKALPQLNQDILLYLLAMIAKLATPPTLLELVSLFQPVILRETWANATVSKHQKHDKSTEMVSFMILWAKDLIERVNGETVEMGINDRPGEPFIAPQPRSAPPSTVAKLPALQQPVE